MDRRGAFDYILLETTGLADPGNIAPIFWVDEGLGSTIYLDGIVTLVDAKNISQCLDAPSSDEAVLEGNHGDHHSGPVMSTAHLQISHADVVVINKSDLVDAPHLQTVEDRVRSINALAKLHITQHSQVPQLEGLVLDLQAYDNVSAESLGFSTKGHSHLDPAIGSMTLTIPILDDGKMELLDEWLRSVLWEHKIPNHPDASTDWEIYRMKGRLPLINGQLKMLQGVREIFEFIDGGLVAAGGLAGEDGNKDGKVVIIGRNIGGQHSAALFQQSLYGSFS